MGLKSLDLSSISQNEQRVWFVEDMVVQRVFPQTHIWLEENARLVANLDVHAQARNFTMRVYLYDPVKNLSNTMN